MIEAHLQRLLGSTGPGRRYIRCKVVLTHLSETALYESYDVTSDLSSLVASTKANSQI
jgi:hypothetical protein